MMMFVINLILKLNGDQDYHQKWLVMKSMILMLVLVAMVLVSVLEAKHNSSFFVFRYQFQTNLDINSIILEFQLLWTGQSFHRCKSDGRPISGPLFGGKPGKAGPGVFEVDFPRNSFILISATAGLLLASQPRNIQYLGSAPPLHCPPITSPPNSISAKMTKKNSIKRGGPVSCTWQQWQARRGKPSRYAFFLKLCQSTRSLCFFYFISSISCSILHPTRRFPSHPNPIHLKLTLRHPSQTAFFGTNACSSLKMMATAPGSR